MVVYSTLLFQGPAPAGSFTELVADPSPNTLQVRDIEAFTRSALPDVCWLVVQPVGGLAWPPHTQLFCDGLRSVHWHGRLVVPPGYHLGVNPQAYEWELAISGFTLTP